MLTPFQRRIAELFFATKESATFARLEITDPETVESMLIDVALDAIEEPPTITVAGPTLTAKELAANKVLALYGRMEPRDFEDTWRLADRFGVEDLCQRSAEKDPGSTWQCSPTA